jgi:hypothetical protein
LDRQNPVDFLRKNWSALASARKVFPRGIACKPAPQADRRNVRNILRKNPAYVSHREAFAIT